MYKKVVCILVAAVLFLGAFTGVASAEEEAPDYVEEVKVNSEKIKDLGNGFWTGVCKYRFFVNGTRRATVKIKHKLRWVEGYGVKNVWSTEIFRKDYRLGDGYFIWQDPLLTNWDEFPSDFDDYSVTSYRRYVYAYPMGWWLQLTVWAGSGYEGLFDCWANPYVG